jgi:uncharacterized protein YggE
MIRKLTSSILVLFLVLGLCSSSFAQSDRYDKRTLTVTGKGEALAAPDVAYLNVSVETLAKSASQAVKENAEKTDKVIKAIKTKLGEGDKVSTAGYNLSPVYEYNKQTNKSEFRGYRASNRIFVEAHNLEDVGAIIDSTAEAGLNNIESLSFETSKKGEYRKKALEKAVNDAKATAETLAKAAGVKITKILELSPSYDYPSPAYRDYSLAKESAPAAPPTPIEPGEITVSATVNIVFEIE